MSSSMTSQDTAKDSGPRTARGWYRSGDTDQLTTSSAFSENPVMSSSLTCA